MIQFTRKCAGDLGVQATRLIDGKLHDSIVAIMFKRTGEYSIFDIVSGGAPKVVDNTPAALNALLALARRYDHATD